MKNCGHRFHLLVANRDFIDSVLVKIISPKNNPPTIVQDKVLALIQVSWLPSPHLSGMQDGDCGTCSCFPIISEKNIQIWGVKYLLQNTYFLYTYLTGIPNLLLVGRASRKLLSVQPCVTQTSGQQKGLQLASEITEYSGDQWNRKDHVRVLYQVGEVTEQGPALEWK